MTICQLSRQLSQRFTSAGFTQRYTYNSYIHLFKWILAVKLCLMSWNYPVLKIKQKKRTSIWIEQRQLYKPHLFSSCYKLLRILISNVKIQFGNEHFWFNQFFCHTSISFLTLPTSSLSILFYFYFTIILIFLFWFPKS